MNERPCKWCGFVAYRHSDEDCPNNPWKVWRLMWKWKHSYIGLFIGMASICIAIKIHSHFPMITGGMLVGQFIGTMPFMKEY